LAEADEERLELRLLSDPSFHEEFDIVVDEISARYVAGQCHGEEKDRVERYFLRAPERQRKVQFMCELLHQTAAASGGPAAENGSEKVASVAPPVVVAEQPGLWDSIRAFWTNWPATLRAATAFATLAVVVAGALFIRSITLAPRFATLELTMASPDRSSGSDTKKINLSSDTDELRLKLKLPTEALGAQSYRAELRGENVSLTHLKIVEQTSDSITAAAPAGKLTRGTYIIELYAIKNGAEQPLRGAYIFTVE
jgi:hypothetical protein